MALLFRLADGTAMAAADKPDSLELQVEVAFLFNFAKFVEWPGVSAASDAVTFCVSGDPALFATLEDSLQGKKVNGRAAAAREIGESGDASRCQILFFGADKKRTLEFLDRLAGVNVLTVGSSDQFARHGGMIRLIKDGNRFRFSINLDAVNRTGLRLSSHLLQLAEVTHDSETASNKP